MQNPINNFNNDFKDYFPFELSPFQIKAINSIYNGKNCLITAHTGSGKTLPAEYSILYFTQKLNKKVIYTSPIKALSNQKLHDFRNKYPNISFGIITGDIEDNKEAQVLIMTTEILANNLLNYNIKKSNQSSNNIQFNMDYENDLGLVIYDEVHYISDQDRGQVWEQSMMLLPNHIQLLMLSATIDKPEDFANWVEKITNNEVVISSTYDRVVPLNHYIYMTSHNKKVISSLPKNLINMFDNHTDNFTIIKQGENKEINLDNYKNIITIKDYIYKNKININRTNVLLSLLKILKNKNMLPCLIFIFSRKQVETIANSISSSGVISLFTDEETNNRNIINEITKECHHILSNKITNYKEYMELPEYLFITKLLEKGIGIHHAGMLPVFRELIEILDEKGFIKVLFATETFAVGVNMPTKTVIFTNLTKYSNGKNRYLHPHEYTQMAGRAGRRGLDTIGHCIICADLFDIPSSNTLKQILSGNPLQINSYYKTTYHIILSMIYNGFNNFETLFKKVIDIASNSMNNKNICNSIKTIQNKINENQTILEYKQQSFDICYQTELNVIKDYEIINDKINSKMLSSKQLKNYQRQLKEYQDNYKNIIKDYNQLQEIRNLKETIDKLNDEKSDLIDYNSNSIEGIIQLLFNDGFIEYMNSNNDETNLNKYKLTKKGVIALNIHESHPLAVSNYLENKKYFNNNKNNDDNIINIVRFLSTLSQLKMTEETEIYNENSVESYEMVELYEKSFQKEMKYCGEYITQDYFVTKYMEDVFEEWFYIKNKDDCINFIKTIEYEYNISLGDFVKSVLKIVKICKEIQNACLIIEEYNLCELLEKIPENLLKFIATNQSLYI